MSLEAVNLLVDLGFLRRSSGSNFSVPDFPFDDAELFKKLKYYREAMVRLLERRLDSPSDASSEWTVFRSSISTDQSLQACLLNSFVADRCIIDDPVASFCPEESDEVAEGMSLMLEVGQDKLIDKAELHNILKFVVSVSPLIEAGLMCFYAISATHRRPFSGAIRYDSDHFDREVPDSIKSFVSSRVRLFHGVRMGDGRTALVAPNEGERSRIIGVSFEGDLDCGSQFMSMYYLSEMKIVEFDDSAGTFTFGISDQSRNRI